MKGWLTALAFAMALTLTSCGGRTDRTVATTPDTDTTVHDGVNNSTGTGSNAAADAQTQRAVDDAARRADEDMAADARYRAAQDGEVNGERVTNPTESGSVSNGMREVVDGTADAAREVTDGIVDGAERMADGVIDGADTAADGMRTGTDSRNNTTTAGR